MELQPTNITRHSDGESSHQLSSGSASFGAMSLPIEKMVSVGAAIAGCDLTPPRDPLLITARPAAMASSSGCTRWPGAGGRGPRNHRRSRCGARAGAGAHRGDDRLPRRGRGWRGQGGAAAARADHAQVSPGSGGKSRSAALYPRNLRGHQGGGSDIAGMLSRAPGMGPKRYLLLRRMHWHVEPCARPPSARLP